jgi:nicotinate-nucleotide--dimethylbenzimidazole phosphoribosyltransferase
LNTAEQSIPAIPRHASPEIARAVRERWDALTKPRGSLGVMEDCVVRLAEIQGTALPAVDRPCVFVFCGDHGITQEGVSLYPSVVTREMVKNFVRGGAAINVLCRRLVIGTRIVDAGVAGPKLEGVIDLRVGNGTRSFLRSPAMSRDEAWTAIRHGIDLGRRASGEFNLVGLGEMGIGNSTSASAILCALTGATPEQAAGKGAGLDDTGVLRKREVLAAALALHGDVDPLEPVSVVSAFAGFEIAMMAGFILGAASERLPVVIDGFISSAAFLIARSFHSRIGEHVLFGHRSAELAHGRLLADAGGAPLLDLGLRLGEGTGAALAMGLLASAVSLYREMATFAEAAVSDFQDKEHSTK